MKSTTSTYATTVERRQGHDHKNDDESSSSPSPWRSLLAGAAAGAFSKTVTAPLERIKLLLQLGNNNGSNNNGLSSSSASYGSIKRTSIRHVVRQVYQTEGLVGFWRGNTPSVLQKMGNSALNFYLMDYYKVVIANLMIVMYGESRNGNHNGQSSNVRSSLQIVNSLLSGGLSGATTTTLMYPLEFVRTRLAVDIARGTRTTTTTRIPSGNISRSTATTHVGQRQFQFQGGMRNVLFQTFETDGIWGIYKGYGPSIVYVGLHRVVYLGGFDVCKHEVLAYKQLQQQQSSSSLSSSSSSSSLTMMERVGIAQSVSLLAATVCYPLDTVRRQLMMQAGKADSHKQFTTVWNCTRYLYAQHGIVNGFFRGLGTNLVKTVGGALLLVAYDSFRNVL